MSEEDLPKYVDGLEVIAVDQVRSPLSTPERTIYFSGARELLLSDGSTVFGCWFCGLTNRKLGRVRVHQNHECERNPKAKKVPLRGVVPRVTNPSKADLNGHTTAVVEIEDDEEGDGLLAALELVLASNARVAEVTEQRDAAVAEAEKWKRRCLDAERIIGRVKERLKDLM